ncbi:hypothetical protein BJ684DRAFT_21893 [Piptocephalis cylindrospora]|uniref:Uncharacterized protein n=1 Tax=Piptocephalis cylindrospora TaxID=1907219 RepID=A0A4P9Y151_9FUNG|nr:hypothetical protein BJ684DRAFT_21893 [Piptocephalis cylindrospora]|eukprot:RKP11530.1 hypothetical protein BJ684DRAFT_21893 [Piptocephalis cylindrospora]
MKLTSILLVSAMLAMALTVAATPTPKDEDSGNDKYEEDDSGNDKYEEDDSGYPTESLSTYSQRNTVEGDGDQFCDITYKGDQPQCHSGYKCKFYKLSDHPTFSGLFGEKPISQDNFMEYVSSEDELGTCVGKIDLNKD